MNSSIPSSLDFVNQFILTKSDVQNFQNSDVLLLGDYKLYTHQLLEKAFVQKENSSLVVIGNCYDYRNPAYTNQEIVNNLNLQVSVDNFLDQTQYFSGVYLFIWKTQETILIIPDLCCLHEVFIDHRKKDEIIAASSPNLINLVNPVKEVSDPFYSSSLFKVRKVWIVNKTCYEQITRLKPNHLLDIHSGQVTRFFPVIKLKEQSMDDVADKTSKIMPGILKAVYLRGKKMMIGLTGGWDSRFLLASAREIYRNLTFFINRGESIGYDQKIANQLADRYNLRFYQLRLPLENKSEVHTHNVFSVLPHVTSASFNAISTIAKDFSGYTTISGSTSEISRNEFGPLGELNGSVLAALAKYPHDPTCIREYDEWLKQNEPIYHQCGYETLDMFYWEEISGNRVAKNLAEARSMNVYIQPAFNCRYLINSFLSVDKKFREKQTNALYTKIIKKEWPETLQDPINPSFKKRTIRLMQQLGIYNFYRRIFNTGILPR